MTNRAVAATLALCCSFWAAWVEAAPPAKASSAPAPTPVLVRPCAPGSPEAKAAADKVALLAKQIEQLAPAANPEPLAADLRALTREPCFALLPPIEHQLVFTSSFALRDFWKSGGRSFFEQVFHWHERDEDGAVAWVAPTPRKSLSLDGSPTHPLANTMLCAERDTSCGNESEGFRLRAETYFTLFDRARHAKHRKPGSDDPMAHCAREARTKPSAERFLTWGACVSNLAESRTRLPLGRFRVPREGWLVVRGRRGHYSFCDEVRAYDLATAGVYVAKSCSGLALVSDGSVDGAMTDAARTDTVQVGRLPVDALREAAWMMALARESQARVTDGFGWYVPVDIEIVKPTTPTFPSITLSGGWSSSSGQTSLSWSWHRGATRVTSGTLRFPNDFNDAASDHAVQLLRVAELGLSEGCAPVAAPPASVFDTTTQPAVASIDATRTTVSATQQRLANMLVRLASSRMCKDAVRDAGAW